MTKDLAILGITRFSVVTRSGLGSFSLTCGQSLPTAEKRAFAASRMRARFRLFEALTLPSMKMIAKQHDRFHYLVVTSSNLPLLWMLRLRALVWRHPWCRILEVAPDGNAPRSIGLAASAYAGRSPLFSFRIDDDDALSTEYLGAVLAHTDGKASTVLRFDRGLYIQKSKQNTLLGVPTTKPLIAIGLGYLDLTGQTTVFDLGDHTKFTERGFKAITVPGAPYWVRSIHAANDSRDPFGGYLDGCLSPAELDCTMREHFPHIDIGRLARSLGPGLRADIR